MNNSLINKYIGKETHLIDRHPKYLKLDYDTTTEFS